MSYDAFTERLNRLWENEIVQISQRFGQLFFNLLNEVRPDIADKIRATDLDPFFSDEVQLETIEFVKNYW